MACFFWQKQRKEKENNVVGIIFLPKKNKSFAKKNFS
jgi:hypothetical protein